MIKEHKAKDEWRYSFITLLFKGRIGKVLMLLSKESRSSKRTGMAMRDDQLIHRAKKHSNTVLPDTVKLTENIHAILTPL